MFSTGLVISVLYLYTIIYIYNYRFPHPQLFLGESIRHPLYLRVFHSVSSFVTGSKLSSAPNGNRPETVTLSKPQPVWGPSREDCSLNRRNRDIQYQIVYSVNPPKLEAQYWIYHIIYITFDRCLSAVVVFPFLLIIIFMYFRGQPSQSFIHSNDQGINPVGLLHPQISKMDQNGRSFLIGPPTSPFLG